MSMPMPMPMCMGPCPCACVVRMSIVEVLCIETRCWRLLASSGTCSYSMKSMPPHHTPCVALSLAMPQCRHTMPCRVCCAVLCYAVLCCAVLYCAMLCCAVLCCAILCYAVLCCAVRYAVCVNPPRMFLKTPSRHPKGMCSNGNSTMSVHVGRVAAPVLGVLVCVRVCVCECERDTICVCVNV